VTAIHPTSQVNQRIARIAGAGDLASLSAAVGLAQNLGALRALAAEGIQRGHMRVHARNVAVAAGAGLHEVERVAATIAEREEVNQRAATAVLRELRRGQRTRPVRQRFRELQQDYLPRVLELIDEVVEQQSPPRSTLVDMAGYHLRTGGKRLRALLPLMVAEAVGSDPSLLIPYGAACEVLHNATLVHDDLQDGDRFRRGLETGWSRCGAPQAVDLGDAMFYLALLLADRLEMPLAQRHAVIRRILTETLQVIDGQERELRMRREINPTMEGYFEMVIGKTSGLFTLPMAGAADLCRSSPSLVHGLEDAARQMGVLFQVHDDLLDLYGDKGRQSSGNDLREGKRSVLVVHALQHGTADQRRWLLDLLDHQPRQLGAPGVQQARELFRRVGSLEFAVEEIARRRERALHAPGLEEHDQMRALVAGMCDLFLEPLGDLLAREEVAA
jgi:geranylgeranyl pyrophosphate synthase